MPKVIEYPRASLKNSLALALAVDQLGGSCNKATCAEQMGKKVSGGFLALVAAATKFGFVKMTRGTITLTQMYKDYKLSYDENEKLNHLRKAFFGIPLFKNMYDKWKDVKLPVNILDKAIVREFHVEEKIASRVSKYFIDAAKTVRLLNPDNSFNLKVSELFSLQCTEMHFLELEVAAVNCSIYKLIFGIEYK